MSSIFNIISSLHIILNDDIKVVVFAQMQILPFSVQLIQRFIMFAAFKHGNKLCITAKPSSEEKKLLLFIILNGDHTIPWLSRNPTT